MKRIKYLIIVLIFGSMSCHDFLDKEPLDIFSDASVWRDEKLVDFFLADLYYRADFIEIRGDNAENTSLALIAAMGGEGTSFGAHHGAVIGATQVITSAHNSPHAQIHFWPYAIIRECNYFIEKIETSSFDQNYKDQRISEARFIRAYLYFQMVIRYGGVPIITEVQQIDDPEEKIFLPRDSEKAVYDFIINETETVAQLLPPQYETKDKGRPTKWAAYALQSRAALYAASIAKYGKVQLDGLLGFQALEVNSYAQRCYDVSKAIINNGIHSLYERYADPVENYKNLFLDESDNNKEVIMAEVYDYSKNRAHAFTLRSMSHDFSGTWASMLYVYNFIERFEFADGSPGNSITREQLTAAGQEWSPDEIFGNRDPRFRASVFYPESPWQGGKTLMHYRTLREGTYYTTGTAEDGWPYQSMTRNNNRTGLMVKKRCNENIIMPTDVFNDETDCIIFRLGEIYLNLAEAAYYLGYNNEALIMLNRIRERAGMPPKAEINEAILQNERLVDLTWENHSYWDIKRWRIAKDVLDGVRMQGLRYTYNYDTKKYRIELVNASPETVARTFQERNYYLPLGVNRVAENPNLIENPDY